MLQVEVENLKCFIHLRLFIVCEEGCVGLGNRLQVSKQAQAEKIQHRELDIEQGRPLDQL